jgi:hypothetical protein
MCDWHHPNQSEAKASLGFDHGVSIALESMQRLSPVISFFGNFHHGDGKNHRLHPT